MTGPLFSLVTILALLATTPAALAPEPYPDPASLPEVERFLGPGGFGKAHPDAPPEIAQFGRLVGIWRAEQEVRTKDGGWAEGEPAVWTWKYVLDGFAIQDLWLHTEEHLPAYLGPLGRSYQLTTLRIWERGSSSWRVAWAANGAGKTPGMDFGTFVGRGDGDDVVMHGESAFGQQRVTFSKVTANSFVWTSEYSTDGKTWTPVMRVRARRVAGAP
jgi:hypothetical protein